MRNSTPRILLQLWHELILSASDPRVSQPHSGHPPNLGRTRPKLRSSQGPQRRHQPLLHPCQDVATATKKWPAKHGTSETSKQLLKITFRYTIVSLSIQNRYVRKHKPRTKRSLTKIRKVIIYHLDEQYQFELKQSIPT